MSDRVWIAVAVGAICLEVVSVLSFVEKAKSRPEGPCEIRYNCEDNSDTTKGHYKGVLTQCVPVKITRTM